MAYASYDEQLAVLQDQSYRAVGVPVEGAAGADTVIDFWFSLDAKLKGGRVTAWQGAFGDTVDMTVVVPDGFGGWVTVAKYGEGLALDASRSVSVYANYAATLPAGARLRCTYHSTGAQPPQITIFIESWFPGTDIGDLVVEHSP